LSARLEAVPFPATNVFKIEQNPFFVASTLPARRVRGLCEQREIA
jgi:hypothetical protein